MFLLHAPLERWVFLLILSVYPYDLLSQVVNLRLGTTNQNLFYQYVKEQTPLCGWESNPQPWLYKNPALTVELPHSDCLTLQIYNFYPNQQVFNQFFFEASARFELANKSFADSPLKPLGYKAVGVQWELASLRHLHKLLLFRVTDGARTHDLLDHNQALLPTELQPTCCAPWRIRTSDPLGVNEMLWTNWAKGAFAGHRLTCCECTFHLVPLWYYDFFCDPVGTRTRNPLIKSEVL